MNDDPDAISAYVQLVEDMTKMAATMSSGVRKMIKQGWECAIVPVPGEMLFYLSLSAPPAPGMESINHHFANIATIKLTDLPITSVADFTAFMQTVIDSACEQAEAELGRAVSRRLLTQDADSPSLPGYYEAGRPGHGAGFLTQQVARRNAVPNPRDAAILEQQSRERLDSARAEQEAMRSILEARDGE